MRKVMGFLSYFVVVVSIQLAADGQQKGRWVPSDGGKTQRLGLRGTVCVVKVDDARLPSKAEIVVSGSDEGKRLLQSFTITRRQSGSLNIGMPSWLEVKSGEKEEQGPGLFEQCVPHLPGLPAALQPLFTTFLPK